MNLRALAAFLQEHPDRQVILQWNSGVNVLQISLFNDICRETVCFDVEYAEQSIGGLELSLEQQMIGMNRRMDQRTKDFLDARVYNSVIAGMLK